MTLTIDAEFQSLIPPLTDEEKAQLEANLINEGCRDALVAWRSGETLILVDGHNRHEICTRLGLPYEVKEKTFETREDVIAWIVDNQLGRRNLPLFVRSELALKKKDAIAGKAKIQQAHGQTAPGKTLLLNSTKAFEPINTRKEIAKEVDTSEDTIRKVENIVKNAPEPIKEAARKGEISTNRADKITRALQGAHEWVINQVAKYVVDDPDTVEILKHLHKTKADTCTEIEATGYIQPGDEHEAVHITAGAKKVQETLDLKAKLHKQFAAEAKAAAKAEVPADLPSIEERFRLYTGDLSEVMPALEHESFDIIITDPPYPKKFISTYETLATLAQRLLPEGGSLLVMTGQSYLPQIMERMSKYLNYQWTLAYLTPGGQSAQLWDRRVNTFWKPVLWFTKGEYKGDWIGDVVKSAVNDNDKRFHHWGQSESGMAELIDKFTYPGQTILDPFLGGGTTGAVAIRMNRRFIGIDIDTTAVDTARQRLIQCALESIA